MMPEAIGPLLDRTLFGRFLCGRHLRLRRVRVRTFASEINHESSFPAAYSRPTSAPIDEPATATISMPRSSSTSMTPMWA
jgi:hypothetical protein